MADDFFEEIKQSLLKDIKGGLRDELAKIALKGLVRNVEWHTSPEKIAKEAYDIADAMLKYRDKI